MPTPKEILDVFKLPADSWQERAIHATHYPIGHSRQGAALERTGAILHRVLQIRYPGFPDAMLPRFLGYANISSDGYVFCDFEGARSDLHRGAFIGSVGDLIWNFRKLADHLALSDADRIDLFQALKAWITKDWRIDPLGDFTPTEHRRVLQ